MTYANRGLTIGLPAALAAAAVTTTLWLRLFGRQFGHILYGSSFYDQPGIRTSFTVSWPIYTIYLGAFAAVAIAFVVLRKTAMGRIGYGVRFFLIAFLLAQCLGGVMQYYFVEYIKDQTIFHYDRPGVAPVARILSTLRHLPETTLLSLTFGVWFTKSMCPAIALSAAVVAASLRRQPGVTRETRDL